MSPGPDFAVVVKNSLLSSRKAGLFTALGVMSGLFVHLAYTFAGLAFVISQSILLFSIIKYAGAAYLLWLGWKGLRAKKNIPHANGTVFAETKDGTSLRPFHAFRQGFLTNALNPKVTLFFLSVFSQFITSETTIMMKLFYAAALLIQNFAWFSLVATVFSIDVFRTKLHDIKHWLDRTMGAVLIALGLRVALSTKE
jgi:RhtB (resistance to homoserine/threonine) family protein